MPRPAHVRITWSGIIGTTSAPVEQWSFGLSYPAPADTDVPAAGTGIAAYRAAYATHLAPYMPTDVILTKTKWSHVLETGRVLVGAQGEYIQAEDLTTVAGTGGPPKELPASAACVVSLMTLRAGPTGKGRFFLPAPRFTINSGTKLYAAADVDELATAARNFVNAVNAVAGDVAVLSYKGYASTVTKVRVGRRPDVLRSRSRSMKEAYEESAAV